MSDPIIWTPEMLTALHALRGAGLPITECAERVGVSYDVALSKCRKLGINMRMSRGRTRATAMLAQQREVAGVISEARAKAREEGYRADDIIIEDDAEVSQEVSGCWVAARVWVENVYIETEG